MKINFKQPRYILPLIMFPFTFLGFYVYQDLYAKEDPVIITGNDGLQKNIAPPSEEVTEKKLADKLATYQKHFKEADGYTAISGLETEESEAPGFVNLYSQQERNQMDSLDAVLNGHAVNKSAGRRSSDDVSPDEPLNETDKALLELLNQGKAMEKQDKVSRAAVQQQGQKEDPLAMMRTQYALIDSFQKANDPEYKAKVRREAAQKALQEELEKLRQSKMSVQRADRTSRIFNTLKPHSERTFIKAIIDEELVGYAGYRIRLRLLEDILVGGIRIAKGTCLYANINGFSAQRVTFSIQSVFHNDQILPVKLDVYDLDGMKGLYVPQSAFREFTRELGSNSIQGMNMTTSSTEEQSRFLTSTLQKAFRSTSQAIAQAIRKNKVKIKYSTYVYLIDSQELSSPKTQSKLMHHENIN
ncbi:MAG: conjugative transposon protein TraM [Prolixibacteraceae bacterium]